MRVIRFLGTEKPCGSVKWDREPSFVSQGGFQDLEECDDDETCVFGLVDDDFDLTQKLTAQVVTDAVNLLQEWLAYELNTLVAELAAGDSWE